MTSKGGYLPSREPPRAACSAKPPRRDTLAGAFRTILPVAVAVPSAIERRLDRKNSFNRGSLIHILDAFAYEMELQSKPGDKLLGRLASAPGSPGQARAEGTGWPRCGPHAVHEREPTQNFIALGLRPKIGRLHIAGKVRLHVLPGIGGEGSLHCLEVMLQGFEFRRFSPGGQNHRGKSLSLIVAYGRNRLRTLAFPAFGIDEFGLDRTTPPSRSFS